MKENIIIGAVVGIFIMVFIGSAIWIFGDHSSKNKSKSDVFYSCEDFEITSEDVDNDTINPIIEKISDKYMTIFNKNPEKYTTRKIINGEEYAVLTKEGKRLNSKFAVLEIQYIIANKLNMDINSKKFLEYWKKNEDDILNYRINARNGNKNYITFFDLYAYNNADLHPGEVLIDHNE